MKGGGEKSDERLERWDVLYRRAVRAALALLLLLVIGGTVVMYLASRRQLTTLVFERRETLANLAAFSAKCELDSLRALGVSLASRVTFRELVAVGKWQEAIALLERVPIDFPNVDRVFLADTQGTEQADYPSLPGAVGENFAHRDWYQGVRSTGQPYVSEVYRRAAQPQYNVIAVAVPIRSNAGEDLGILVLQVRLASLLNWVREMDAGEGGFIYLTDQRGHIAVHPAYSPDGDIVDYSSVPAVQRALQGESGVDVLRNPVDGQERVSGYHPVEEYGWTAVVAQAADVAFAERDRQLRMLLALGGLSLFIAAGLALGIDYMIRTVVQQREKERIFLESIGDGIIAIDRSWRITLWNHAAEMMTGWTAAEAVGRSFRDTVKLVHELNGTENIGFIEETMLFGRANQMASDTLLIRRDGSKMPVADSAAPIYGGNGAVHGAIIVFRDVSADRDLARAREEMHALTSHQLQSPVTVIKYAASMLLDGTAGPISAQHRELIEQIARAAENMSHLTSMLLEASRAESGTIGVSSHPVSLEEVVGPILDDVAPDAAQRRITIERALSPSLPLVKADASIIEMGLRNLLANALKYTPPNGRVRVSTALEGKEFIIAVADTGIGVPEKERAELFKKFFRASNAREARADGTGLGLYVVKSLMEQAGGDVRYTPAEQGSVFSLVIPAAGMQPKQGIRLAI